MLRVLHREHPCSCCSGGSRGGVRGKIHPGCPLQRSQHPPFLYIMYFFLIIIIFLLGVNSSPQAPPRASGGCRCSGALPKPPPTPQHLIHGVLGCGPETPPPALVAQPQPLGAPQNPQLDEGYTRHPQTPAAPRFLRNHRGKALRKVHWQGSLLPQKSPPPQKKKPPAAGATIPRAGMSRAG